VTSRISRHWLYAPSWPGVYSQRLPPLTDTRPARSATPPSGRLLVACTAAEPLTPWRSWEVASGGAGWACAVGGKGRCRA